MSNRKYSAIN